LAGDEILASRLTMIDIDALYVEAKHPYDRPPVALIETVEVSRPLKPDGYHPKSVNILYQLGRAANVPVFLVLYLPNHDMSNPADRQVFDITEFYVKEYYPVKSKGWKVYSPEQYAQFLVNLRQNHLRIKKSGSQLQLPLGEHLQEIDDDDIERRWYVHEWARREFVR
jgi:hypothetical protein